MKGKGFAAVQEPKKKIAVKIFFFLKKKKRNIVFSLRGEILTHKHRYKDCFYMTNLSEENVIYHTDAKQK